MRAPAVAWISMCVSGWLSPPVCTATPTLYAQPFLQSPVRGEPDDLLMLGGYGFADGDRVVYATVTGSAAPARPPPEVPETPGAETGYAAIVSAGGNPYALTIRLPAILHTKLRYALWVRSARGEWSNAVSINDPRPLWLTPAFAYSSAKMSGLPRYLKIVGRSLDPLPGRAAAVKLEGPARFVLKARRSTAAVDFHVAMVSLPPNLPVGLYRVSVARDGVNWTPLEDQAFDVQRDPKPVREFRLVEPRFGNCRPNDGRDDTACIVRAIAAAGSSGGGTVVFDAGTWEVIDSGAAGVIRGDGIIVPAGVSLRGRGPALTQLSRDPRWNAAAATAVFTFQGDNEVEGFAFQDRQRYRPGDEASPFLLVGENSDRLWAQSRVTQRTVRNLRIFNNRFERTSVAIASGGLSVERLMILNNEFGAYRNALELGGNIFNMRSAFRIDDSVITGNVFKPGSFLDVEAHLGPIASEIGASQRLDFSDNVADGASAEYLYPAADARGWRAGFFWHMNNNHEMLLISNNVATCTGDKTGDGEAFALDNSGNTFAFDAMRTVVAADAASVTVEGPLASRQHNRDVPVATYYAGHWMQVGDGPGIGQARKIVSYTLDPASGRVTFRIAPRWDVVPLAGTTRISVGREFWQTLVIGNRVDHRAPLCLKSNRLRPVGGAIAEWAQTADSVIAGNQQYDTEGVTFHENYNSSVHECSGCGVDTFFQTFLDIRENLIDGKYDSGSDCTSSGITGGVSASPAGRAAPPTLGYGMVIAHNRLANADNTAGGAIAVVQGWYDGPPPHRWPLLQNLLVHHNQITGRDGPIVGRKCSTTKPRRGISFTGSALTWNSVLYANACDGGSLAAGPGGYNTLALCADGVVGSCECRRGGDVHP